MAYDSSKEIRADIGQVMVKEGEKPDYIRISKVQYGNGPEKIDIRLWYTDKNENIQPTSKGFRFLPEFTLEVICHLVKILSEDEIEALLEHIEEMALDE